MSDSDTGYNTPPEISKAAKAIAKNLLPPKSKAQYETIYKKFIEWRDNQKLKSLSESVLLVYFNERKKDIKPSTLWAQYSMLRATLKIYNQVDISKYSKLNCLLKRNSESFKPKKSKVLTSGEIQQFLTKAPDNKFLATKVALIFGIKGACRSDELIKIKTDNVESQGRLLYITLKDTKNKDDRSFVIDDEYCEIVKRYHNLRPANATSRRFFLNFQNGKCYNQPIGKNKFGNMPKLIAQFLGLPEIKKYTGHCFRRTAATLLADAGANSEALCRFGGWKSAKVAEGYVENSVMYKAKIGKQVTSGIKLSETTPLIRPAPKELTTETPNIETPIVNADELKTDAPQIKIPNTNTSFQFINCSNINITFANS